MHNKLCYCCDLYKTFFRSHTGMHWYHSSIFSVHCFATVNTFSLSLVPKEYTKNHKILQAVIAIDNFIIVFDLIWGCCGSWVGLA